MNRALSCALRSLISPSVVALCLSSCAQAAAPAQKPRPVRTQEVALSDGNDRLVQTGDVQPRRETELSFPIDGRLARRLVEVGAFVSKGQVLAVLDDRLVQNELRAANADLTSTKSALELAETSLSRQARLLDVQSVSRQQMDESKANANAAAARRDVAAAAALNAQQKLSFATLRAPEAGVVTAVGANPGQVLSPGQMVVRLATRERDAVFAVAEQIVMDAPPDAKIEVRLISNPAVAVTGSVRELSPAADPITRTYRVRVELPNAPDAMSFGAAVTGMVEYRHGQLVELPASAVTSEGDKPAVYVVDAATKKLERRVVEVARFDGSRVFIKAGLKAGERVVTAGVSKLWPEQVVALAEQGGNAR